MRSRSIICLLFVLHSSLHGQVIQQAEVVNAASGNTYAVIVGISEYGNGITQLDFAHKDAQLFADYLKSKAGGSVPDDNIRLLLNKQATQAAIYNALYWLLQTCQKDDLVYFYFSGHGDLENTTIHESGFLLSYDTYRVNYINHALRIEDLNDIANTLSVRNKARVILITDACHSGKLAGKENKGTLLVGEQLRTVLKNEVRITSCAPDQLSNEDEGWGGGRGVFSYYLIKGLEGLADYSQDNAVTVGEIKKFLDTSLSSDRLLAEKAQKQNPIVSGLGSVKLSSVDKLTLQNLTQEQSSIVTQSADVFLKPLVAQPQTYLFDFIGKNNIEELVDFNTLTGMSREQIPFEFINMLVKTGGHSSGEGIDSAKIDLLKNTLIANKDALKRFNEKLVVIMSDRGQEIINQYLEGDEAELDRRRYYNSEMNRYDIYPKMFAVALKLTPPDNHLYRILNIKLHYFAGVAARLKLPMVENPAPLLALAMSEQKKALMLEENAAYIHNELGILHKFNKDLVIAERYFLRATEISPQWALPWSNLAGLYAQTNNYEKGIAALEKARERQPGFQGTFINAGILHEKKGNLLLAEEFLRKSIKINSRHYLPFEKLGYVYMNTTHYDLANSFFYEAEKRKKGYHFMFNDADIGGVTDQFDQEQVPFCHFDSADVRPNDVMGHFVWGMTEYDRRNYLTAEREFKKVIALDKTNPLAFHYLGKILYKQKRWKEAEIILKYALSHYLDSVAFNMYNDSLVQRTPASRSLDCMKKKFSKSYYEGIEDRYFLGSTYEKWNHFEEAIKQYEKIIEANPEFAGGYYKLWNILEKIGHYSDAEKVILRLGNYHKEISDNELNAFYGRMTTRFPKDGTWPYKAGLFLYDLVAINRVDYKWDLYPDNQYRSFIQPDTSEDTAIGTKKVAPDIFGKFDDEGELVDAPHGWIVLPGTWEYFIPADTIDSPYFTSISNLKEADSLFEYDHLVADINYRIGDLYVWQNLPDSALSYYQRSLQLYPSDAGTRKKLIHAYTLSFNLKNALVQLDSLYQRNEINFANQLQMSEYCIHQGRFADAAKLLAEARQIYPYQFPAINDLSGRLQLLSKHPQQALAFYKAYLSNHTGDENLTMYTIAKLNAQLNNSNEAWKWLKLSIDNGFDYYWVLTYDKTWDNYRKLRRWKEITGKVPAPSL